MDWLTRMNRALDYIEMNISGEIDLTEIASQACCSSYQFQRMFSFITDVTLAEYIRRRRLTLAAIDLLNSDAKVIEIANRYGYDSPVSFAELFNRCMVSINFGSTRRRRVESIPTAFLPYLNQRGCGDELSDRNQGVFQVFGIERVFQTSGDGDGLTTPEGLWQQCHANGEIERLTSNAGELPVNLSKDLYKVHAVCSYRKTENNTFPYMLCSFKSDSSKTDGYLEITIPSHTWAIFPSELFTWDQFTASIESLYHRFYSEWLPTAGYEQVDGMEFEVYGGRNGLNYVELWFAVRKIS